MKSNSYIEYVKKKLPEQVKICPDFRKALLNHFRCNHLHNFGLKPIENI